LRGLARAGVIGSLSVIGYDVIPVVGAETMERGMAETFCDFLSVVKLADHVSAISEGSAEAFRAFGEMLAAEGILGPAVKAHTLPTELRPLTDIEIEEARASLRLTGEPVVLAVGSHEPRKNHMAVLEACERLWGSGLRFELLMAGGSEWRYDEFKRCVDRLRDAGLPVNVRKRVTDTELWAAYRLARFSVFPSLLEGFGLPVAESIAAGTPVITSSHGSMAEIAAGGGALLVDPRDIDEITTQMRRLLTDDALLERLRRESRTRDLGTWDDYARDVWEFFTREASDA
jgi:glycosyltransferase involved in cell wall biosynthesis